MTAAKIEIPPKLIPIFAPARGAVRYRAAYGGRGSGKSFSFALMAAVWGYVEPLRILCTRELQISIKESMFAELKNAINTHSWLAAHYEIGESFIRGRNGTEFLFRGLRHNMSAIKSMAQIDLCIVEEAEDVPEQSWLDLLPTVRAERSEIWCVWNRRLKNSPVDKRLIVSPPDNAVVVQMNYCDNPWFPKVLDQERLHDRERMDDATYAHVWEGAYLENSEAQVLHGKYRVDVFEPGKNWDGPYLGMDFGFATDPTTAVKCWIFDDRLYIEHEAHKVGLELDDTAEFIKRHVPGIESHSIRADSARPESISYLARHGLPRISGVKKWAGSVEDGIQHLRSYKEIIIHERCKQTLNEARLWSYKTDRHTGDILPKLADGNEHIWDAVRYALQPMIQRRGIGGPVPVKFTM